MIMQKQFDILSATRNNVLNSIKDLSLEELNTVPTGFKNSIAWNVAHIVVTQQLLCYKLSGLALTLQTGFVDRFKKGSVASDLSQDELNTVKSQLVEFSKKLEEDYKSDLFKSFNEYPTSYNVTLNSVEDAIQFNNIHEGLHFGYIMAMKKVIIK
jgi:uncharacterized damage-inducible protein DinB